MIEAETVASISGKILDQLEEESDCVQTQLAVLTSCYLIKLRQQNRSAEEAKNLLQGTLEIYCRNF